ncbi:DUF4255 domain-containing protein [Streptomyces sp. P9(2023)]|uniref:DUF4255 domain-containing protein n=1 Tax=Streptomyces sp. P9(2023) TaxID=3064394 RepID=UPI0028F3FCE9|nr:DUF4255 domain-containing protein [Streptomyces sp. P9(2023)]MDT9689867.1 DUF4255 domain-containing protein [Streptomyces sp. P9(2023)]
MIHEIDEGVRLLLTESGLTESGVDLVFDPPTREWAARRNAPTISVFLYDIREDVERRRTGTVEEYDEHGMTVARRTPPRWFDLTYLVTAWTNRPQDEHRLLSEVLRCLARTDVLPRRFHTGTLVEMGLAVPIEVAGGAQQGRSPGDVWSALGGELKASIDLRVLAPMAGERVAAARPVTDGLVVRTPGPADGTTPEPDRQLRYQGVTDPGAGGFAGRRERPDPAERPERGDTTERGDRPDPHRRRRGPIR